MATNWRDVRAQTINTPEREVSVAEERLSLLSDHASERCPAYGRDCRCPAESAVRRICERTAANIHR